MKFIIILLNMIGIRMGESDVLNKDSKLIRLNLYTCFFIFTFITCQPLYFLYESYCNSDTVMLSVATFMLIPVMNYIILLNYFRKPYFFKLYTDIVYNEVYHKYSLDRIIFIISIGMTILSLIITYTYEILGYNTVKLVGYSTNMTSTIFLYIYGFIYNFYSRFIFFFNTIIFFVVFYKHYIDLNSEGKRIKEQKSWNVDKYKTGISIICYNLLFIRSEINKSISLLEYLYISSTMLGAISIGIILEHKELNIFLVGSIAIWCMMQIVFLFIMTLITNKREDLKKIINKPKFCFHYLIRSTNTSPYVDIIENIDNERRKEYFIENISLDILSNVKQDPNQDSPQDSPQDSNTESEKIIRIVSTDNSPRSSIVTLNEENAKNYKKNKMNAIQKSIFQNSSSVDWLILHKILDDEWAVFEFMGIKFENVDGIKKIVCMVAFIIYIVNVILNDFELNLQN
jgi:hypothetical protein